MNRPTAELADSARDRPPGTLPVDGRPRGRLRRLAGLGLLPPTDPLAAVVGPAGLSAGRYGFILHHPDSRRRVGAGGLRTAPRVNA